MTGRGQTPAQIDKGTPETRKHKRRSTMERLIETKRIGGYEVRAAQEIEWVFTFICKGLFSKTMRYDERTDKANSDHVPEWFNDAYHSRYKPWADNAHWTLSLCISVLLDGLSASELDQEHGWRNGTAATVFVGALRDYAIHANWVDRVTLEDWRRIEAA